MKLKLLNLKDKEIFDDFLGIRSHKLSVYSFANIYIWRSIFDIQWKIIDNNLCVFFSDPTGCFLYLPPLGENFSSQAAQEAFKLMDKKNKCSAVSRLEASVRSEKHSPSFATLRKYAPKPAGRCC